MLDMTLLVSIIAIALTLFVGGWLPVDLVGLLVLAALALTGLVTPTEALAGFSSSAVITVLALFIISAGLSRTGVAYRLGQPLQRLAGSREWVMVAVLMATASLLSALINTTTVAVILLPAAMDLAKRSGRPPSRLLLPMALGCLLGGPFTAISTPPNMMIIDALKAAGLAPFGIFDFTPITGAIVVAGIAFVALPGMRLLPRHGSLDGLKPGGQPDNPAASAPESSYQLGSHIFSLPIRPGSPLAGRTLSEARLGSALNLTVLALKRAGETRLAPPPTERLAPGDTLVVHGAAKDVARFRGGSHLALEPSGQAEARIARLLFSARGVVGQGSPLVGTPLAESTMRREHRVHLLAIENAGRLDHAGLLHRSFTPGDALLLLGEREALENIQRLGMVQELRVMDSDAAPYGGNDTSLFTVHVPEGSALAGSDLTSSRLGNAFGLTVVGVERQDGLSCMPAPDTVIQAGDTLVLHGSRQDLDVLRGLQELDIAPTPPGLAAELESQQVCATEVLLSPRTTLTGKTLADLRFREHYGLNVLAVWRGGAARRTKLQDLPLQFGDAMLVYGPRKNLAAVARDPDFLVLDRSAAQAPLLEKAPIAAAIMAAVILSAILGLTPISIAALTGAALMVLFGCIDMDAAYRAVEWKVLFLIATLLPLGVAFERTGAARMGAEAIIALAGDMGPRWVVAALFLVTVLGTQVIPTAALVVLMTPVALGTATDLNISPHLLMMTVAMAASASFASPLSHPAHLLVMGPGGYRFMDYVRVGVPLTLVTMLVCVWLLPLMWPA